MTDEPEKLRVGFREWLSQPWIGPTISLIVLAVSLSALAVSLATYFRQGARWQSEADDLIQLQFEIQSGLTKDNLRPALVQFYTGRELLKLKSISMISPDGVTVTPASHYKPLGNPAAAIELDPLEGIATDKRNVLELLIRLPKPPTEDQGMVVEIEAIALELSGDKRTLKRRAKAIVPPQAQKVPNLL